MLYKLLFKPPPIVSIFGFYHIQNPNYRHVQKKKWRRLGLSLRKHDLQIYLTDTHVESGKYEISVPICVFDPLLLGASTVDCNIPTHIKIKPIKIIDELKVENKARPRDPKYKPTHLVAKYRTHFKPSPLEFPHLPPSFVGGRLEKYNRTTHIHTHAPRRRRRRETKKGQNL